MNRIALVSIFLTAPLWAQEAEDIRGAKPLIEIPAPEKASQWPLVALVGFIILLLIVAAIWWMNRRKRPSLTSEQWARRELDDLRQQGSAMKPGDFALAASDIVRVFIERKFGLAAPKRTTEEFLRELSLAGNETIVHRTEPLRGFLKSCDMAKFGRTNLELADRENLIANARAFVESPQPPEPKEAA